MPAGIDIFAASSGSGNFLVQPGIGVMIWTLITFGIAVLILRRAAYPRIAEALDKRRMRIEESIDAAARARAEADRLLQEYRERLREAREQADEIMARARKAAEVLHDNAKADAEKTREELLAQTRRDIEAETRRSLEQIRREVADLTVLATEKIARKTLTPDDHDRLIQDALEEFDFAALPGASSGNGAGGG
jgi:F-type H+-transporting ATPase subunit b